MPRADGTRERRIPRRLTVEDEEEIRGVSQTKQHGGVADARVLHEVHEAQRQREGVEHEARQDGAVPRLAEEAVRVAVPPKSRRRGEVLPRPEHLVRLRARLLRHAAGRLLELTEALRVALGANDALELRPREEEDLAEALGPHVVLRGALEEEALLGEVVPPLHPLLDDGATQDFHLAARDQDGATHFFAALHDVVVGRVDVHLGALHQGLRGAEEGALASVAETATAPATAAALATQHQPWQQQQPRQRH